MKKNDEAMFFVLLAIAFIIAITSYAPSIKKSPAPYFDISSCGVLNITGAYSLIINATSTGPCFTIKGNGITLDCNQNAIIGETQGYGIEIYGNNNVVRNCTLIDFPSAIYVSLTSVNNSLIDNELISTKLNTNKNISMQSKSF